MAGDVLASVVDWFLIDINDFGLTQMPCKGTKNLRNSQIKAQLFWHNIEQRCI
jgi:hypothetical protein